MMKVIESAVSISKELESEGFQLIDGTLIAPTEWTECSLPEGALNHEEDEVNPGVFMSIVARYQKTYEIAPWFPRRGVCWVTVFLCDGRLSCSFEALK
jgi:hypothetical protein